MDSDGITAKYLQITDTIIKVSTTLLVIPVIFITFFSEISIQANPDAVYGENTVSIWQKLLFFGTFGASILSGIIARFIIVHITNKWTIYLIWFSGIMLILGLVYLLAVIFNTPMEFLEPFRLGRTGLG